VTINVKRELDIISKSCAQSFDYENHLARQRRRFLKLSGAVRERRLCVRGRMLDGMNIELKDAIKLALPTRASCLEPG
jgi:hypothetical protein